jgi:hypothetical protein
MPESGELAFGCEPLQWLAFKNAVVIIEIIEDTAIEYKISRAYPRV